MLTFEIAGEAMLQVQEGNRGFALALARTVRRLLAGTAPAHGGTGFASPSFFQQEPNLAQETHLPGTYIGII